MECNSFLGDGLQSGTERKTKSGRESNLGLPVHVDWNLALLAQNSFGSQDFSVLWILPFLRNRSTDSCDCVVH